MTARFELWVGPDGQHRWRLVDPDGHTIAISHGHATRAEARRQAEQVAAIAPTAAVDDQTAT